MFKQSSIFEMLHASPLLFKSRFSSGVNQFGLKPETTYDFANPTQLINHGRGTSMESLDVRRGERGLRGSSPSFQARSIDDNVPRMLGLVPNDPNTVTFCSAESAALRVCMAKGEGTCERENRFLEVCLSRVGPLRSALSQVGRDYQDWFTQSVSDNYTTPHQHRPQDHRHKYAQDAKAMAHRQGPGTHGRYPKQLRWDVATIRKPNSGMARRSRMPING